MYQELFNRLNQNSLQVILSSLEGFIWKIKKTKGKICVMSVKTHQISIQ